MKLGALKSAIKEGGTPKIRVNLVGLHPVDLDIQKGSLLAALDASFPEGRAQETGLYLQAAGFIDRETNRAT
jgi:hypothetical protein